VCGATCKEAVDVIESTCREKGSSMVLASEAVGVRVVSQGWTGSKVHVESEQASYGSMMLPLLGEYQSENLATAISAMEVLSDVVGFDVPMPSVKTGIEAVEWQGRCQVLQEDPRVILDGAHNPAAAGALARSLGRLLKGQPLGMIIGMCSDKDVEGFLGPFSGLVRRMWAVPIPNERNIEPERLMAAGKALGWAVEESTLDRAITEAKDWASSEDGVVCVAGSLFLAGEVIANENAGS
jgi:dihydrofolate synthase/folylpolyglutamate synthase